MGGEITYHLWMRREHQLILNLEYSGLWAVKMRTQLLPIEPMLVTTEGLLPSFEQLCLLESGKMTSSHKTGLVALIVSQPTTHPSHLMLSI